MMPADWFSILKQRNKPKRTPIIRSAERSTTVSNLHLIDRLGDEFLRRQRNGQITIAQFGHVCTRTLLGHYTGGF